MLKKLRIQGYRSLRDVTWEPGRLNVLIGPNASGKTNLLSALSLMRASVASRKSLEESIFSAGGMIPLLWNGQSDEAKLHVEVEVCANSQAPRVKYLVSYDLGLSQIEQGSDFALTEEINLRNQNTNPPWINLMQRQGGYDPVWHEPGESDERAMDHYAERLNERETALSRFRWFGNFPTTTAAVGGLKKSIEDSRIYQGLATQSHTDPLKSATVRKPVVGRAELLLDEDGGNLVSVLSTWQARDTQFDVQLDSVLSAAFQSQYDRIRFPADAAGYLSMHLKWKDSAQPVTQLSASDGTLRLLMLTAILSNPGGASLIAIDEPELGLHPRMLSIVATLAHEASLNSTVLLATHSSDLLDQLAPYEPDVFVTEWAEGETLLKKVASAELRDWMKDYQIGDAFRSGELEALA